MYKYLLIYVMSVIFPMCSYACVHKYIYTLIYTCIQTCKQMYIHLCIHKFLIMYICNYRVSASLSLLLALKDNIVLNNNSSTYSTCTYGLALILASLTVTNNELVTKILHEKGINICLYVYDSIWCTYLTKIFLIYECMRTCTAVHVLTD
jgi:predicted membrane protein